MSVPAATSKKTRRRGRVVVCGLLGAYPFGGMTWQVLHYLAAFRDLGFDVWYAEHTLSRGISAASMSPTEEYAESLEHIRKWMQWLGLGDRWVYSPPSQPDLYLGALDRTGLERLYREADALFNICGAQELTELHRDVGCLVYIETDPVEKQVFLAEGQSKWIDRIGSYDHLFTYAENINGGDCRIPDSGFSWRTTRPPVMIDWWQVEALSKADARITSIATWKHKGKDVCWNGERWRWSKHHGFLEYIDTPLKSALPIELAVGNIDETDRARLARNRWLLSDPAMLNDPDAYRQFIRNSLAEFTVAKEQYVKPKSGWFSDRSVCYLAAARPVITMETGFSKYIPSGEGLFGYSSKAEVQQAIEALVTDYGRQSQRAFEIAQEYFDSSKVVSRLAADVGLL